MRRNVCRPIWRNEKARCINVACAQDLCPSFENVVLCCSCRCCQSCRYERRCNCVDPSRLLCHNHNAHPSGHEVHGLEGSTHIFPDTRRIFGIVEWIMTSTAASHQLPPSHLPSLLTPSCFQGRKIRHYSEQKKKGTIISTAF